MIESLDIISSTLASSLGISPKIALFVYSIILVWSLIWKGIASWKSARKGHIIWFVVFFVINTIGILEILYIYVFSKLDEKTKRKKRR